jgi:phosphohistidine swiveling domain-containing protein
VMVGVEQATQNIRDGEPLTVDLRKGLIYSGSATKDV